MRSWNQVIFLSIAFLLVAFLPVAFSQPSLLSRRQFELMLKHRNNVSICPANGFYTYDAFIAAANSFPGFATVGDVTTKKREIAAFLAQTSRVTGAAAPDDPYAWGYCYKETEGPRGVFCEQSPEWPCAAGKKYFSRGPIQITFNYNYGPAGRAIGEDLLNNPDLVATDPVISFKTAFWFWMTPMSPKPSLHDAITGRWTPSDADREAGRVPGYGVLTNILNGETLCRKETLEDGLGFYKRYCDILDVSYGDNLDCSDQWPFSRVHIPIWQACSQF